MSAAMSAAMSDVWCVEVGTERNFFESLESAMSFAYSLNQLGVFVYACSSVFSSPGVDDDRHAQLRAANSRRAIVMVADA